MGRPGLGPHRLLIVSSIVPGRRCMAGSICVERAHAAAPPAARGGRAPLAG